MFDMMIGDESSTKSRPIHEAQILRIKEAAARYGTCPFNVGDLVTPRLDSIYRYSGEPMVVVEVRNLKVDCYETDLRAMLINSNGDITVGWYESWVLMPYYSSVSVT